MLSPLPDVSHVANCFLIQHKKYSFENYQVPDAVINIARNRAKMAFLKATVKKENIWDREEWAFV